MFNKILTKYREYKFKKKIAKSPKNLNEALEWFNIHLSRKAIEQIRETTDGCHFGLGMNLRNEWGLWYDSPLAQYFNSIGIYNADDMSGIILESYHRLLNGLPINLDEQVKSYKEYWEKYNESL
jgi:hypothetical protein